MKIVKRITPGLVMSWSPCEDYTESRVTRLLGTRGRKPLDLTDMGLSRDPKVPVADLLWCLLRPEVMGWRPLVWVASDCAAHVLDRFEAWSLNDWRPRQAILAARSRVARNNPTSKAKAYDAANAAEHAGDFTYLTADADAHAAGNAAVAAARAARAAAYYTTSVSWITSCAQYASVYAAVAAEGNSNDERRWQIERIAHFLRGNETVYRLPLRPREAP